MTTHEPLTFRALDDISLAAERGRLNQGQALAVVANDLGPLMELEQHAQGGLIKLPDYSAWVDFGPLRSFHQALRKTQKTWVCQTWSISLDRFTRSIKQPIHHLVPTPFFAQNKLSQNF